MSANKLKGAFFPIDEKGKILNPTQASLIPENLRPVLTDITSLYQQYEADNLHSIWLRGSVPRGFYTEGISDIDLFALVHTPGIRWQQAVWAETVRTALRQKYGKLPDIELAVSTYTSDLNLHRTSLSFIIKTQSLLLQGKDIRPEINDFKLDEDIKINSKWLREDVKYFQGLASPHRSDIILVCKTLIRSAFEHVMLKEGKYTVDLPLAAEVFCKHVPCLKSEIHTILEAISTFDIDIIYLKENIGKVYNFLIK